MDKKVKKSLIVFIALFLLATAWTVIVAFVDRKAVESVPTFGVTAVGVFNNVGLSHFNESFRDFIGNNKILYIVTDYGGIPPFALLGIFGLVGLVEWIKRKNILKVDINILALGIFYLVTLGVFFLFEFVKINYRPFLLPPVGEPESSYPSSTTVLALTILATAPHQISQYFENKTFKTVFNLVCVAYGLFLIVGRIFAGVHWITDIIGAVIISSALVFLYFFLYNLFNYLKNKNTKTE